MCVCVCVCVCVFSIIKLFRLITIKNILGIFLIYHFLSSLLFLFTNNSVNFFTRFDRSQILVHLLKTFLLLQRRGLRPCLQC